MKIRLDKYKERNGKPWHYCPDRMIFDRKTEERYKDFYKPNGCEGYCLTDDHFVEDIKLNANVRVMPMHLNIYGSEKSNNKMVFAVGKVVRINTRGMWFTVEYPNGIRESFKMKTRGF